MSESNFSERLLITLAVMSATLIQVLDTTIVNVALPHMAGELGATTDQTNSRLRPKRWARKPVAGVMIAAATI